MLYFSFNVFRKHKFAAPTVKGNFHSCLELRIHIVFNEFHWIFSDFGLQGALVSGEKDAAVGNPWQSCSHGFCLPHTHLSPLVNLELGYFGILSHPAGICALAPVQDFV